jgi:superfamily II DNA/RNA helicase
LSKQSFADLGVSPVVVRALAERGIDAPFAIQALVIADTLEGRDVLARSPTGSGKTLAFGIPIVDLVEATDQRPSALILAPTRELATQITEELRSIAHSRALKISTVYGGVGIEKQAREVKKSHILVATPGRLEDLIARKALKLDQVNVLVLDEADRMLDMGFRPAVDRIVSQTPVDRQTLFFSATLEGEAGRIASEYTNDPARHEHTPKERRPVDIEHHFVAVERAGRVDTLVKHLDDPERDLALVFVRTKRGADRLVKKLGNEGVKAVAMHGDKTQGQRERALQSFTDGRVDTLVATDVAARGIDVDRISHVINFDPPADREGYVHRIGRTARAGRSGVGVTFVDDETASDVEKIAGDLKLDREFAMTGLGGRRSGGGGSRNGGGGNGGGRNGGPSRTPRQPGSVGGQANASAGGHRGGRRRRGR